MLDVDGRKEQEADDDVSRLSDAELIQQLADTANFPKWCTAPLGHAIRTRQTRSFCTGDKAVALRTGKPAYSAASRRFSLSRSSV
jgi:hypothetical protein